jgi:hypothetical protein
MDLGCNASPEEEQLPSQPLPQRNALAAAAAAALPKTARSAKSDTASRDGVPKGGLFINGRRILTTLEAGSGASDSTTKAGVPGEGLFINGRRVLTTLE